MSVWGSAEPHSKSPPLLSPTLTESPSAECVREHQIACAVGGEAAGRGWGQTRGSAEGPGFVREPQQFLEQEGNTTNSVFWRPTPSRSVYLKHS